MTQARMRLVLPHRDDPQVEQVLHLSECPKRFLLGGSAAPHHIRSGIAGQILGEAAVDRGEHALDVRLVGRGARGRLGDADLQPLARIHEG